jgi:uncharacterized membrane protein YkoI
MAAKHFATTKLASMTSQNKTSRGNAQRSIAMKMQFGIILLVAALSASPLVGMADDTPPTGSLTLYDVAKQLEKSDYGPIADASFDDGNWEVEAFKDGVAYELMVDPSTGAVVAEHRDDAEAMPPAGSKLLSEIVSALLDAGYTDVNDVSFEGQSWEVEARRDNVKRELRVNPATAEVISDRADD